MEREGSDATGSSGRWRGGREEVVGERRVPASEERGSALPLATVEFGGWRVEKRG